MIAITPAPGGASFPVGSMAVTVAMISFLLIVTF